MAETHVPFTVCQIQCFPYVNSLNPSNSPLKKVLLKLPFYRPGDCHSLLAMCASLIASKWRGGDLNPGNLVPKALLLASMIHSFFINNDKYYLFCAFSVPGTILK